MASHSSSSSSIDRDFRLDSDSSSLSVISNRSHYAQVFTAPCREAEGNGLCLLCPHIMHERSQIHPTTTDISESRIREQISCQSSWVVYRILCFCGMEYVGQTYRKLNRRFSGHRQGISGDGESANHFVHTHIAQCCAKNSDPEKSWTVQVLHLSHIPIIPAGLDAKEKIKHPNWIAAQKCLDRAEVTWQAARKCVYPHGLVDRFCGKDWVRQYDRFRDSLSDPKQSKFPIQEAPIAFFAMENFWTTAPTDNSIDWPNFISCDDELRGFPALNRLIFAPISRVRQRKRGCRKKEGSNPKDWTTLLTGGLSWKELADVVKTIPTPGLKVVCLKMYSDLMNFTDDTLLADFIYEHCKVELLCRLHERAKRATTTLEHLPPIPNQDEDPRLKISREKLAVKASFKPSNLCLGEKITKQKVSRDIWLVISWRAEVFKKINFPAALRLAQFPKPEGKTIRLSFQYRPTVHNLIINHKTLVRDIIFSDDFWKDCNALDICGCRFHDEILQSELQDSDLRDDHVFTPRLEVIKNLGLRKLLGKGPKFRFEDPSMVTIQQVIDGVKEDLSFFCDQNDNFEDTVEGKQGTISASDIFLQCVRNELEKLPHNQYGLFENYGSPNSREANENSMVAMASLQRAFALSLIDKAAQNYSFICRRLYLTRLFKEFGLSQEEGSLVFSTVYCKTRELCLLAFQHTNVWPRRHKLGIPYWLAKYHKGFIGIHARFITAAINSCLEDVDLVLMRILEKLLESRRMQDLYSPVTRRNFFWIIKNSADVLKVLKKRPQIKVDHVISKDFTGLFPNLPIGQMKCNLRDLVHSEFQKMDRIKIRVPAGRKKAFWVYEKRRHGKPPPTKQVDTAIPVQDIIDPMPQPTDVIPPESFAPDPGPTLVQNILDSWSSDDGLGPTPLNNFSIFSNKRVTAPPKAPAPMAPNARPQRKGPPKPPKQEYVWNLDAPVVREDELELRPGCNLFCPADIPPAVENPIEPPSAVEDPIEPPPVGVNRVAAFVIHDEDDDLLADSQVAPVVPPEDPVAPMDPAMDPPEDPVAPVGPALDPELPDSADSPDTDEPPKPKTDFTADEVISMIEFFLDSSFFIVGNAVLHCTLGIFMGPHSSPSFANSTLHVDEQRFLEALPKPQRRCMKLIWRFIDDLLIINNKDFPPKKFYHPSLSLEDAGKSFLELDLVHNQTLQKLDWDLYDKTRKFGFVVRKYPHPSSCIRQQTIKNVIWGEVQRLRRVCNSRTKFDNNLRIMRNTYKLRDLQPRRFDIHVNTFLDKLRARGEKLIFTH